MDSSSTGSPQPEIELPDLAEWAASFVVDPELLPGASDAVQNAHPHYATLAELATQCGMAVEPYDPQLGRDLERPYSSMFTLGGLLGGVLCRPLFNNDSLVLLHAQANMRVTLRQILRLDLSDMVGFSEKAMVVLEAQSDKARQAMPAVAAATDAAIEAIVPADLAHTERHVRTGSGVMSHALWQGYLTRQSQAMQELQTDIAHFTALTDNPSPPA